MNIPTGGVPEDLLGFITLALAGRQRGRAIELPMPSSRTIDRVRGRTGVDLSGFRRLLRGDDISHVHRSHGNIVRETARGQQAIEKRDYMLIPILVELAHRIELKGEAKAARPQRLIYHAELGEHVYEYVETIHPREKVVALKSLLKR